MQSLIMISDRARDCWGSGFRAAHAFSKVLGGFLDFRV